MADVPRPQRPSRLSSDALKPAGMPVYHDYRQGRDDLRDCCMTKRPACPAPPVGAGKGFKGF